MTGAVLGLIAGLGLLLIVNRTRAPSSQPRPRLDRVVDLLRRAGLPGVRPVHLLTAIAGAAAVAAVAGTAITGSVVLGVASGVFGGHTPVAALRKRAHRRADERRDLWPDVVDHLASGVRAGLSLPEALAQVGDRGPPPLRPLFAEFGRHYRATGRFGECLDALKDNAADPVADRIVEAMRLAREVGGNDLGRLLRALSQFLRDDARARAELLTRQGWTVNAARLALAAPWAVLALLSLRPEAVAAYDSPDGVAVLTVGGAVSVAAYRLMLRIARLPDDERILR